MYTIIHQTKLGSLPKPLCYRNLLPDFLQVLTSMKTNPINQQYSTSALVGSILGFLVTSLKSNISSKGTNPLGKTLFFNCNTSNSYCF
jgi:hypothetical protein